MRRTVVALALLAAWRTALSRWIGFAGSTAASPVSLGVPQGGSLHPYLACAVAVVVRLVLRVWGKG